MLTITPRIHGGPDALGVPRFDFSTNSNACGPCPAALTAVQKADATRYPDASYTALRTHLAEFHGVDAVRVVLAGSASEFIFRITAWVAQRSQRGEDASVCVPIHAYGDYAQAARPWGLRVGNEPANALLQWCCEPSSPLGNAHTVWPDGLDGRDHVHVSPLVLDCAYAPLRLSGTPSLNASQIAQVWQMFSPNKSLGLTGVRAAYAIAPQGAQADVVALDALAPSWPVGAHGVAMLKAWVQPAVQHWLATSLHILRDWKAQQIAMLQTLGWSCLPSDANFFCARPAPGVDLSAELLRLRLEGIKLRDTTSFGLPGHVRLGVLPPVAQDALRQALLAGNR
jgi:histidinol-phosphate aminotransferase